jgi:hypothetical protein
MQPWVIFTASVFFFYGLLTIYVFISISRSIFKYRVYGLSLNLLIGIATTLVATIIAYALNVKLHQVIDSGEPHTSAELRAMKVYDSLTYAFIGI